MQEFKGAKAAEKTAATLEKEGYQKADKGTSRLNNPDSKIIEQVSGRHGVYLVNGKDAALRESALSATSRVEAGRGEADLSTGDLFSIAPTDIPPETARAQAEENHRIKVEQVATRQFKSALGKAQTPEDAAHVLSPIGDRAQEEFVVLVTNANDKILHIISHTKGLTDRSPVSPGIVAGAIAATDGAANVWVAHNHPSGDLNLAP